MAIEGKLYNMTPTEGFSALALAALYATVLGSFIEDNKLTESEVGERLDFVSKALVTLPSWKRTARRLGVPENMRILGTSMALIEARPFLFGEQETPKSEEGQNG